MLYLSLLPPLSDLCITRIAYSMWTRRDLTKKRSIEKLFDKLVDAVLADVQNLPLPKELKSRVLQIVQPAGQRLLRLLDFWLSTTQRENSQQWLTGELLNECLVLNPNGLINQRETAQKILSSRKLNNVCAFRLACLNFFENEVLNLWIDVKHCVLDKLVEYGNPLRFLTVSPCMYVVVELRKNSRGKAYKEPLDLTHFPYTTESDEVLFWISYCLSKENGTDIKKVPHFIGTEVDWYRYSLQSAAYSGNVAWLEYFKNICKSRVEYNYVEIMKGNFDAERRNRESCFQPSSFIFHFMLLNSREKAELFRKCPIKMVDHFLEWPLSQTFVESTEELWNLIPDIQKGYVFEEIFAVLFHKNPLLNSVTDGYGRFSDFEGPIRLIHNPEHLRRIWIALWEISLDSDKLAVLNSMVFPSIRMSKRSSKFSSCFKNSGLKNKLLHLFLSNGEAVFQLYEGETMKESLRALVAKYMPEEFEDLDSRCISFLKTQSLRSRRKMKGKMKKKVKRQGRWEITRNKPKPLHEHFLNYIKKYSYQRDISVMPPTKKRKLQDSCSS